MLLLLFLPASAGVAHSTFAIDTLQMATMMRLATTRSLLLIDEYGKGTDMAGARLPNSPPGGNGLPVTVHCATDGISLAAACIKTLRVRAAAEGGAGTMATSSAPHPRHHAH